MALAGLILAAAITVPIAELQTAVRVWQASIELPTYAEDAPNPNPPFDLFTFGRFSDLPLASAAFSLTLHA